MSPAPKPTTYKQYRKFEVLLDDLRKWIVSPEEDRRDQMAYCADQVGKFTQTLVYNPSQVSQIIDTINLLRASAGPGVVITEEELMRCLSDLMFLCVNVLLQKRHCGAKLSNKNRVSPECETACHAILDQLIDFARGCFSVNRPRDSFGGKRRIEAFSMLGNASRILNLPDVFELAQQTLKDKKSGRDASGALAFLEEYFSHNNEPVSDALQATLKKFATRTTNRSLATGALNILVITNCISEFEALDRIDTWKEAHQLPQQNFEI